MQWADRIGRRIKLRDLHVLHAVVQSGSMTKAARELAISVPVVSKAIAELEHTVGVPLLDRSPQGVEPTAYGRALLRRGLAAFDELRQGMKDIEFICRSDDRRGTDRKHRAAGGKLRLPASSTALPGAIHASCFIRRSRTTDIMRRQLSERNVDL